MALRIYKAIPRLSVVTPWLDHPELIPDYETAVKIADEVVIVDNGSDEETAEALVQMLGRLGYPERHLYLRQRENGWFSGPTNEGIRKATGDVVVAVNNDIKADPSWLSAVRHELTDDGVYGPSSGQRVVDNVSIPYIEGWCVAARRETWQRLGGFDAEAFARPYWEDVDLSFRAMCLGLPLYRTNWFIDHLSNTTSAHTPGAYDHSEQNRLTFEARVREFISQKREVADATAQAVAV